MRIHRNLFFAGWQGTLIMDTESIDEHSIYSDYPDEVEQIVSSGLRDMQDKLVRLREEIYARRNQSRGFHRS